MGEALQGSSLFLKKKKVQRFNVFTSQQPENCSSSTQFFFVGVFVAAGSFVYLV